MQLRLASIILGLAAIASAMPQDSTLIARQNQNRPVPNGACCVANTNLKQDACTAASGQAGRCVPGGNNCKFPAVWLGTVHPTYMRRTKNINMLDRRFLP